MLNWKIRQQRRCFRGWVRPIFFWLGSVLGVVGCGSDDSAGDILNIDAGRADCRQASAQCEPPALCIMTDRGTYECQLDEDLTAQTEAGDTVTAANVSLTVRVVDPFSAQPISGVALDYMGQSQTTDASGSAIVQIPSGPYGLTLENVGAPIHRLQGVAGVMDFTQITFMGTEAITAQTLQSLGLTRDLSKGFLVVGLDRPNLSPAVGASATLTVDHDPAFVFGGFAPTAGTSIPVGGQSFVSFPNTAVGEVTVEATNSPGSPPCFVFPAGQPGASTTVDLRAGEIAVIAFTCPNP